MFLFVIARTYGICLSRLNPQYRPCAPELAAIHIGVRSLLLFESSLSSLAHNESIADGPCLLVQMGAIAPKFCPRHWIYHPDACVFSFIVHEPRGIFTWFKAMFFYF